MARILVIEDDADTRVLLAHALRHAGHVALLSTTARAGISLARTTDPDLVLLDLVLPDLPGTSVLETLMSDATTRRIPVIILSGRTSEADRIAGLELGAEDYVTKPFSVRELMLRVGVALRRRTTPSDPPEVVTCGCLRMDLRTRRVLIGDEPLSLTPLEFRLLATLAARAEAVQTREALLADVWGSVPGVETRTVDAHIKRLREKLGPAGARIETVRGVGYRFLREAPAASNPESVNSAGSEPAETTEAADPAVPR